MRNAFADELTKLGDQDSRVVMLSGDIGNRLFDKFKAKHPARFFNCGVAEANMMGVAAGMAMNGLRPVAYTITPFVTTRCLEQIRTDVCYHEAPVTIVAVGAGLAYAGLGPTHHACEDISFLRSIPNMVVICPGDAFEVRAALQA
jgi:transketolase